MFDGALDPDDRARLLAWMTDALRACSPSLAERTFDPAQPFAEVGVTSLEMFSFIVGLGPDLGFEWSEEADEGVFQSLATILDYALQHATRLQEILRPLRAETAPNLT